jgi:hypothetical protein
MNDRENRTENVNLCESDQQLFRDNDLWFSTRGKAELKYPIVPGDFNLEGRKYYSLRIKDKKHKGLLMCGGEESVECSIQHGTQLFYDDGQTN